MKYTTRKDPRSGSLTAVEIKRLLDSQEPPIGNTAVAQLIGVTPETINSIVYRGRTPGVGILNGLARALELDKDQVKRLFDLHEKDLVRNKIKKATEGTANAKLAAIMEVLNPSQLKALEAEAMRLALSSRGKK